MKRNINSGSNMKIVIDIDEEEYKDSQKAYEYCKKYGHDVGHITELIGSGVPLSDVVNSETYYTELD